MNKQHLSHSNEKIRALAIKNLAKTKDISLLKTFAEYALYDNSTNVRRESASALGRLRSHQAIPELIACLSDPDPKVIIQAIRGLSIFAAQPQVKQALESMHNHPNEIIQAALHKKPTKPKHNTNNTIPHAIYPAYLKNTIVHSHVCTALRYVPNESVHLTFTSPPYYNARDYSIYQSYEHYLDFLETVFEQVHRITKPGRFFVLNTSPIIIPRISRAHASKRYPIPYDIHPRLIKMGWEFIDDIVWVKPEASVKNRNAGFLQHRKPLAYKPNTITEMVMVYRKATSQLIDWNMRQYDTETIEQSKVANGYETTNVWRIDPSFDKVHSAVFPVRLCERVIKYYSFVGDLVFDPFAGRGTLGYTAKALQRAFFLVEKESRYIARMRSIFGDQSTLFYAQGTEHVDQESLKFLTIEEFIKISQSQK